MIDPMEKLIRDALIRDEFTYTEDGKPGGEVNKNLDFHLTDYGIHIEVKRMHSPRIAEQMSRVDNIIVAQGKEAVEFLAALLCDYRRFAAREGDSHE